MSRAAAVLALAAACSPETVVAVSKGDEKPLVETPHDAGSDARVTPAPSGYHTRGPDIVDSTGTPVRIHAVTWAGLESNTFSPNGLNQQPLGDLLRLIKGLGFDTIRLTWSSQIFDPGSTPGGIDFNKNPDLTGLGPLRILDAVVTGAKSTGLRVILARQRASAGSQSNLWYDDVHLQQDFFDDWTALAGRYAGEPTVIGCELESDLRGEATWGDGNEQTDWQRAAVTAGNDILRVNPDVLVIVGGIETAGTGEYWRGGNLQGVATKPVTLQIAGHVVYATEDFPASAYDQPPMGATWLSDPGNLPEVWDENWGYIFEQGIQGIGPVPVFLAEFGTAHIEQADDQQWLSRLETYIQLHGLGFSYWALNPQAPVSGIMADDSWTTVRTDLVNALAPILKP